MEKVITVIVSSKKSVEESKELINNIQSTIGVDSNVMFIQNNGISLTKVYNEAMAKSDTDIVVFMHDDVEMLRSGWGSELVRMFHEHQDYGIIGVAGSSEFDEKAMWWGYKEIYGQVLHRNNGQCWLTSFSPLLKNDLQEVCVIDGLFMAVHKKRTTYEFNKEIDGFNFYDIDFCLGNFLEHKTKIGVTTNIRLAHNSIGKLSDNWFKNKEIINQKYGNKYPIHV
jgi:hypothetical protein